MEIFSRSLSLRPDPYPCSRVLPSEHTVQANMFRVPVRSPGSRPSSRARPSPGAERHLTGIILVPECVRSRVRGTRTRKSSASSADRSRISFCSLLSAALPRCDPFGYPFLVQRRDEEVAERPEIVGYERYLQTLLGHLLRNRASRPVSDASSTGTRTATGIAAVLGIYPFHDRKSAPHRE